MDLSNPAIGASVAETSRVSTREDDQNSMRMGALIRSSNQMVTIYVGPAKVKWVLYETVLCNKSEFFKNAFQGKFSEATTKTMDLPEDDPVVFELFVDWLFGENSDCVVVHISKEEKEKRRLSLYGLEAFADKIGCADLASFAIVAFSSCNKLCGSSLPSPEAVNFVYDFSSQDSKFRSIFAKKAMEHCFVNKFEDFKHWSEIMAINTSFGEDVGREIRAHLLKTGDIYDICQVSSCLHHPSSFGKRHL